MSKKIPKLKQQFNIEYKDTSEEGIQREILYYQIANNRKLEKIRTNTSNLVWFLIVIPILMVLLSLLAGGAF